LNGRRNQDNGGGQHNELPSIRDVRERIRFYPAPGELRAAKGLVLLFLPAIRGFSSNGRNASENLFPTFDGTHPNENYTWVGMMRHDGTGHPTLSHKERSTNKHAS
jgi:hypothetical protein